MPSRPSRRRLLRTGAALLGAGLAGCSEADPSPGTATDRSTTRRPTSTGSPTTERNGRVTYANPSLSPADVSFEWTAELLQQGTSTAPPELELRLTNTTPEPVGLRFGPTPPFSDPVSGSDEASPRLALFHPDMGVHSAPSQPIEGCWQLASEARDVVSALATLVLLRPERALSETYELYNTLENGSCFPAGTYAFADHAELRVAENVNMVPELEVTTADGRIDSVEAVGPKIPDS